MLPTLTEYDDLLANVRYDSRFHSARNLVQPDYPLVKQVAAVLRQAPDFVGAAQDFVHDFAPYSSEVGDFWAKPGETLAMETGDCDDLAILLCSILRNEIPADQVYCAVGILKRDGKAVGHMWVDYRPAGGPTRVIESTAPSWKQLRGIYQASALFNDEYAFATDYGLKTFGLMPLEEVVETLKLAGAIPPGS